MSLKKISIVVGIIVSIGALVLSFLKFFAPQKEQVIPAIRNTKVEIKGNGDNVNRDKIINNTTVNIQKPKTLPASVLKATKNEKPTINNGIINQAPNYGSQTINNNYNGTPEPRKLNSEDINTIKTIPLDYKVEFSYINSSEESIQYAKEILLELKKRGYNIIGETSMGMYIDVGSKPQPKGERIYLKPYNQDKKVEVIIREQK